MILMDIDPIFEFLPIEAAIKDHQAQYYAALGASDKKGQSGPFVLFMLKLIDRTLSEVNSQKNQAVKKDDRMTVFLDQIAAESFSRKDYLLYFKTISEATASRDLREAVEHGILEKQGTKRLTTYRSSIS